MLPSIHGSCAPRVARFTLAPTRFNTCSTGTLGSRIWPNNCSV
jgi:hypothetical protein